MKRYFPESKTLLTRYISTDGRYRLIVLESDAPGRSLSTAHGLSGDVAHLFRDAVNAVALMSVDLKQTMKVILQMKWDVGGISVEADWAGRIRGYIREADEIELQYRNSEVFGGTLSVIRMIGAHPGYTGYGGIFGYQLAGALQSYYDASEQTQTRFHFGDGSCAMVQRLPDSPQPAEDSSDQLEEVLEKFVPILDSLADCDDQALASLGLSKLSSQERLIECSCSREKIGAYIAGLHIRDLRDLYHEGPWPIKINCENCSSQYDFSREEIGEFLRSREAEQ